MLKNSQTAALLFISLLIVPFLAPTDAAADDNGIARLDEGSSLDASFGNGGLLTLPNDGITVRDESRGYVHLSGNYLYRYDQTGSLDTTFGQSGVQQINRDGRTRVAVDSQGRIVVATVSEATDTITVRRYLDDGSLDNTFSVDGIQETDLSEFTRTAFPASRYETVPTERNVYDFRIVGIEIDSSNRVTVIGSGSARYVCDGTPKYDCGSYHLGYVNILAVRYTNSGAHDDSFGNTTTQVYDFWSGGYVLKKRGTLAWSDPTSTYTYPAGTDVSNTGELFISGNVSNRPSQTDPHDGLVVKFTPDGLQDNSFGNYGKIYTEDGDVETGYRRYHFSNISSVVHNNETGKTYALGTVGDFDLNEKPFLLSLQQDGSWNTNFGNGGLKYFALYHEARSVDTEFSDFGGERIAWAVAANRDAANPDDERFGVVDESGAEIRAPQVVSDLWGSTYNSSGFNTKIFFQPGDFTAFPIAGSEPGYVSLVSSDLQ